MEGKANLAQARELERARGGEPAHRYTGPERRRHRVYVTRNTEYHVRERFCVAVRDRRSGEFLQGHLALSRRVEGGLKFFENGAIAPNPGEPRPGEAIYFVGGGRELVTSPLESVGRPSRDVALGYPPPQPMQADPSILDDA